MSSILFLTTGPPGKSSILKHCKQHHREHPLCPFPASLPSLSLPEPLEWLHKEYYFVWFRKKEKGNQIVLNDKSSHFQVSFFKKIISRSKKIEGCQTVTSDPYFSPDLVLKHYQLFSKSKSPSSKKKKYVNTFFKKSDRCSEDNLQRSPRNILSNGNIIRIKNMVLALSKWLHKWIINSQLFVF